MAMASNKPNADRSLEASLWAAADKLRGTLDAAEYKHVVLGLIFLKYISDAFEVAPGKSMRFTGAIDRAAPAVNRVAIAPLANCEAPSRPRRASYATTVPQL